MRFTITPLGSAGGRSVGQVVTDIVRYLDRRRVESQVVTGQAGSQAAAEKGPSQYYADGGVEPGRWLGHGATEMGLAGEVDPTDIARVLSGRDPHTGVRLITARGSAGRRSDLGRGSHTRWGPDGEPLYDLRDAAAALKLEPAEVEAMVAAGESHALGQLGAAGGAAPSEAFGGSYLVPVVDRRGHPWVSEAELARCEEARAAGPDADRLAAAGTANDILPLGEAARLAGVSARYLRTLAGRWERDRDRIESDRAEGKQRARPHLIAYRGTKRQWLVRRPDLVDFVRHRTAPIVRVGFDLTLTTEKSLGVLALLGDDACRTAVLGAIQAGNDRGLAHLEYAAAMVRVKGEPTSTRGWTVASFRHLTSRALDPFPHHHNVIANTVAEPSGERRALDARYLYRHAGSASALATAEMRHRLTQSLGVGWRRGRKGGWEIDGIHDDVLREFSRRSNEVDDAVAELEELIGRTASIGELRRVVTRTRPAKRQVDPTGLVAGWWERARALGLAPRRLRHVVGRVSATPTVPERSDIFARLAAPEGLCAGTSVFTRADVLAGLVDMAIPDGRGREGPLVLPADEVEALADDFLASDLVVELLPTENGAIRSLVDEPVFTTAEMLSVQTRLLDRYAAGRDAAAALCSPEAIETALAVHQQLTDEQRQLVSSFCTSGAQVQCAIGRAGAGKTTAMRAAASAWSAAGFRVMGAAVKGDAARHLGVDAGIPTETLAWHLAHTDPRSSPLDARTVLIVDEASTVSDRDLDRLVELADQTGAAVRLIGDPGQHGAVGAGGMFSVLCRQDQTSTPELSSSHRVHDPHDRAAAEALRDGRIGDALAELDAAGHLHVVVDELQLHIDLLERWWESRSSGHEHPMVDRRNHTRFELNRLAHRLLQTTGEVGGEEVTAAGRGFSVGDRVVARRGDRDLHPHGRPDDFVRNGARGTVTRVSAGGRPEADTITVAFDDLGEIDLPRPFFDEHAHLAGRLDVGLDHAYSVTSYAVQGATFTESASRIDENTSRAEAYVDITRGRQANHLYLTRSGNPLDGERLPRAPSPPVTATVGQRLSRSGPERPAVDVDPSLVGAENPARFFGSPAEPELAEARIAERRARQAARIGPRRLDADLLGRLSPRRQVPYLAHQWDEAVSKLAGYLGRWGVVPGGGEAWNWALGPAPTEPEQARERDEVSHAIIELTTADTSEALHGLGATLPEWARWHLEHAARQGRCRHDPDRLIDLYAQVAEYRRAAGVGNRPAAGATLTVEEVVGPVPAEPALRVRRNLLAESLSGTASARPAASRR